MAEPATPKNVDTTSSKEKTGYVVLVKMGGDQWERVDTVHATNATAAIRAVATGHVNGPRTYVAIPQRSWKPVTAKIDTKTVLTLTS
jgi:hypothetical protein